MGIFSGLFRSRDKPTDRTAGSSYAFYLGGSTSGKVVTERSAMQMTAVYACVRILSEAIAGLPLQLYRYKEDGGKEKAIDHPLYLLLHDEPNPEMSSFVFRETLMTHLLLWGNAYAQVIRNGKDEVVALYPLMPNKMTVDRDDKGQLYYSYNRSTDEAPTMKGNTVILRPSDVLHIPGLGFDGLVGYSPIAMAKNAIGLAIATEEYGAKFFANGAAPSGVLEHPGTIKDPTKVREAWQSQFGGSANSGKIAVLEEGIPATLTRFSATPISAQKKRKVAGYARVSTDHDDQFTSYEAQIDYYTNYIKGRDDWEFVSVYTDEGITGTSTKRREGFKRMIADALDGKIDLIVTKSVSRFARNTVDSLTTIRELKEHGTEVYFEKENIWTFDAKGEVLITIMSSLAQEESRSISENCTWGQRKRFADGKVTVPFKRFLGYDRGEDGNLVVNPEQAEVVRRIYGMFLKGMTPHGIAKTLTDEGVPTPAGKHQWGQTTIKSILSNEKYKGDALLQKTFCEDFLTKKMKTNQGEVPQYYVENNHEAIIDAETFEMVQRELARRTKGKNRHSGVHLLSGRIKCGDCGGWYGSKVWHSPEKCKRTIWQCNQKYKNEVRCTTPYLDEASVKDRFTVAVNQLLAGRDAAIAAYEQGMALTLDTTELDAQQQELLGEMEVLNGMLQQMIRQNATVAQDQTEYNQRFDSISEKFKEAEAKKDEVSRQISDIRDRRGTMEDFLRILKQQDGEVTAFSEKLWCGLLDFATSYADGRLTFTFKNGSTFEG